MSQTMNGHSLEENRWQRLKPISSAAWQRCTDPGKELSSGLSDQKKNLIDLTEARMDTDKWNIDTAAESVSDFIVCGNQLYGIPF